MANSGPEQRRQPVLPRDRRRQRRASAARHLHRVRQGHRGPGRRRGDQRRSAAPDEQATTDRGRSPSPRSRSPRSRAPEPSGDAQGRAVRSAGAPSTKTATSPAPDGAPRALGRADQGGALVDAGDRQARRGDVEGALGLVLAPGVVVGDHGDRGDQAEAEGDRAAAGVDHRVAEHHAAGTGAGHDRAALPGPTRASHTGESLSTERRCIGLPFDR